jgi:hypothetical protein
MLNASMQPDPWQLELLRSTSDRLLVLTHRQAGKSSATAAVALHTALLQPGSLTLLLSPSERQSGELALKVWELYDAAKRPIKVSKWTALQMHLVNGSRIIALPGEEKTIRGYSGAALLIVDEAARVPDALYCAVRPMLGISKGRLICLSTPFGKRGFFHDEWESKRRWERYRATADECPRLTAEFLEEEKDSMGIRWYRQEYCCSFEDCIGAVFSHDDVMAAFTQSVQPLFLD